MNTQLQLAIRDGQGAKFARQHQGQLTKAQLAMVHADKSSRPSASQASQHAKSPGTRDPLGQRKVMQLAMLQVRRMITGSPLEGLLPVSPRDHPEYNEAYCAAGMPASMPYPRPYVRGLVSGQDKVGYVSARTLTQTQSVAPGQTVMILPHLWRDSGVIAYVTVAGVGIPTTAVDWTAAGASADRTIAETSHANWEGLEPQSFFEDSSVVDATYYTALPSATAEPLLKQRMGTRTTVKFATTYNGQAEVRVVSPGDSGNYVGRNQERHRYVLDRTGYTGQPGAEFTGDHHTVYQPSTSETPLDFAKRAGKVHMVGGNKSATFHVDGSPDYSWTYWGALKAAVAADAGHVSVNANFEPRLNIAHRHKMGMIFVTNNSTTDNLVVYYKTRMLFAVLLQADDSFRSIPALATQMRRNAARLISHVPPQTPPRAFFPTIIASDESSLVNAHQRVVGDHAQHGDTIAPSSATIDHQTETSRAVEAVNDAGAAMTVYQAQKLVRSGEAGKMLSSAKNAVSEFWSGLKTIGTEVAEVGGSILNAGSEVALPAAAFL